MRNMNSGRVALALAFALAVQSAPAFAQDACSNGDFENGVAGWTFEKGTVSLQSGPLQSRVTNWSPISTPLCQSDNANAAYCIANTAPGADPAASVVPTAWGGAGSSMRLGGSGPSSVRYISERMSRTFTVTPATAIYNFKYAIVMDESHPLNGGTAYFTAYAVDTATGAIIDKLEEPAEATNPFIAKVAPHSGYGSQQYYRNWRCANLNLSSAVGKQVTVYFQNADCGAGGHRGHTYVDDVCVSCGANDPEGGISINAIADRCTRVVSGAFTLPQRPDLSNHKVVLDIYKNGALFTTITNPSLSGGNFTFDLSNAGLAPDLGCFDVVARQEFTINDLSGNPQKVTQLSSNAPSGGQQTGVTAGLDNDVCMDCGKGDAILKVCKIAGEGVGDGAKFPFSVDGKNVVVPAGPAPGGYCTVVGQSFTQGSKVVVKETGYAGYGVKDISVAPQGRMVANSKDLVGKSVEVKLGAGVTEVTFENLKTSGFLEICKDGNATGKFEFKVETVNGVETFSVPAKACTHAIEVPAGDNIEIVETKGAGFEMTDCWTLPADRQTSKAKCNRKQQTSIVKVVPGGIAQQTIAFVKNVSTRSGGVPGPADAIGVEAQEETSFRAPRNFADTGLDHVDEKAATVAVACGVESTKDVGFVRCTASVASAASGVESPTGMVSFIRNGETLAILPLRRDGSTTLALPASMATGGIIASYQGDGVFAGGASAHVSIRNAVGAQPASGFRFYQPGEEAPSDDDAGMLNRAERSRLIDGVSD